MVALLLFAVYTSSAQYGGLTWSLWLTVVSFILGPFWFNPVTFEWNKLQEDYTQWIRWMMESGGTAEQSWEVWWKEENSVFKNLSISWKIMLIIQKSCLWIFLGVGLAGMRLFRDNGEQQKVGELLALYAVFFFGNWCISKLERSFTYAVRRMASLTLSSVVIALTVYLFVSHTLYVKYTIAIYYTVSAMAFLCLLMGFTTVAYLYKMHDYLVGHTIFLLIGILSTIQIGYFQTWLLYHNALSTGVVIEDVLKHARRTKEMAGIEGDSITELRAALAAQERTIRMLVQNNSSNDILSERSSLLSQNQSQVNKSSSAKEEVTSVPSRRGLYGSTSTFIDEAASKAALDAAIGPPKRNGFHPLGSSGSIQMVPSAMKTEILPVIVPYHEKPHRRIFM
jgi:callose synthase